MAPSNQVIYVLKPAEGGWIKMLLSFLVSISVNSPAVPTPVAAGGSNPLTLDKTVTYKISAISVISG
jgi:hypothetical protein